MIQGINEIEVWMRSNRLRLNMDKTQVMWLGSKPQLAKITQQGLNIGGTVVMPVQTAKNLGCLFDSELTLKPHINAVTKSCFYQLRQIRSIRNMLSADAVKTLVHSFISNRIDYCNSIFFGAPNSTLTKLQSVLNAAARLITSTTRFDHIQPVLKELHWLPIRQRINYKIASLVRGCVNGEGPSYIQDLVTTTASCPGRAHLRSAQHRDLVLPRSRTKRLGNRSFRLAAPIVWNALPVSLHCLSGNCVQFKSKLKTHLFVDTYE